MSVRIGIDLGTTISLVAVCRAGAIEILDVLPSIVAETEDGQLLLGDDAATCDTPRYRHSHFKRSMGSDRLFELSAAHGGPTGAQGLSARVLERLAKSAAEKLGVAAGELEAVITVPADFRDNARNATKEAAAAAGLRLLDLVMEPVAAAAAYFHDSPLEKGSETYLVYDLGGGTFDACVCVRTQGRIEIGAGWAATKGHQTLGGRDFDAAFVAQVLRQNKLENLAELSPERVHASSSASDVWDLRRSAERQREKLSDALAVFAQLRYGGKVLSAQVKRADFEETIRPFIDTTLQLCDEALLLHARGLHEFSQLTPAEIGAQAHRFVDGIVLVGGTSRTPLVEAALAQRYPGIAIELSDPEQAVAKGAALYSQQYGTQADIPWLSWQQGLSTHLPCNVARHPPVAGVVNLREARSLQISTALENKDLALKDGCFRCDGFPVPDGESEIRLAALDEHRRTIEEASWRIFHGGDDLGREGLAHDIHLSLRSRTMPLLKRGHPPGVSEKAPPLFVADESKKIKLPLLEDSYPLGCEEFQVAAKPGDPVEMSTTWSPGELKIDLKVGATSFPTRTFHLVPRVMKGTLDQATADFKRLYDEARTLLAQPIHEAAGRAERQKELDRLATAIRLSFSVDFDQDRVDELLHDLQILVQKLRLFGRSAVGILLRATVLVTMIDDVDLKRRLQDAVERVRGGNDAVGSEILEQCESVLREAENKVQMARINQQITAEGVQSLLGFIRTKLNTIASLSAGRSADVNARLVDGWTRLLDKYEADLAKPEVPARATYVNAMKLSEMVSDYYQQEVVKREMEGLLSDSQ